MNQDVKTKNQASHKPTNNHNETHFSRLVDSEPLGTRSPGALFDTAPSRILVVFAMVTEVRVEGRIIALAPTKNCAPQRISAKSHSTPPNTFHQHHQGPTQTSITSHVPSNISSRTHDGKPTPLPTSPPIRPTMVVGGGGSTVSLDSHKDSIHESCGETIEPKAVDSCKTAAIDHHGPLNYSHRKVSWIAKDDDEEEGNHDAQVESPTPQQRANEHRVEAATIQQPKVTQSPPTEIRRDLLQVEASLLPNTRMNGLGETTASGKKRRLSLPEPIVEKRDSFRSSFLSEATEERLKDTLWVHEQVKKQRLQETSTKKEEQSRAPTPNTNAAPSSAPQVREPPTSSPKPTKREGPSISTTISSSTTAKTRNDLRLLAQPSDTSVLNPLHVFVRNQIEVFCATQADLDEPAPGRKNRLRLHQVGLRCIHCANHPKRPRVKRAICYPSSVGRVYHCVSDMKFDHFVACPGLPSTVRNEFERLVQESKHHKKRKSRTEKRQQQQQLQQNAGSEGVNYSSSTAQYYHDVAILMGMRDHQGGVFFAQDIPQQQAHDRDTPPLSMLLPSSTHAPSEEHRADTEGSFPRGLSQKDEDTEMKSLSSRSPQSVAQGGGVLPSSSQPMPALGEAVPPLVSTATVGGVVGEAEQRSSMVLPHTFGSNTVVPGPLVLSQLAALQHQLPLPQLAAEIWLQQELLLSRQLQQDLLLSILTKTANASTQSSNTVNKNSETGSEFQRGEPNQQDNASSGGVPPNEETGTAPVDRDKFSSITKKKTKKNATKLSQKECNGGHWISEDGTERPSLLLVPSSPETKGALSTTTPEPSHGVRESHQRTTNQIQTRSPSLGGVPMSCGTDVHFLSPLHCFVRRHVEFFEASQQDLAAPSPGRKVRIQLGQVGLRCIHCARLPPKQRVKRALCYPQSVGGIYHAVSNMKFDHFGICPGLSLHDKLEFQRLRQAAGRSSRTGSASSTASGSLTDPSKSTPSMTKGSGSSLPSLGLGKWKGMMANSTAQYYHDSAVQLGLIDTEGGIRFQSPPCVSPPDVHSHPDIANKVGPDADAKNKEFPA